MTSLLNVFSQSADINGPAISIQLAKMDTPEIGPPYSLKSSKALSKAAFDKTLTGPGQTKKTGMVSLSPSLY